jgi:hypothetical protein
MEGVILLWQVPYYLAELVGSRMNQEQAESGDELTTEFLLRSKESIEKFESVQKMKSSSFRR